MNLSEIFFENVKKQPEHPLIIGPGNDETYTYGQFGDLVCKYADTLRQQGLGKGDCVGIHSQGGHRYIAWTYALWSLGGCAIPVPTELTPEEKIKIFKNIHIDAVISDKNIAADLSELQDSESKSISENTVFAQVKKFREHPAGFQNINAAFIRFTSGTTGDAKGVVLSHETVYERIHAANRIMKISPDDRVVWLLSMAYHFAVSIVAYLSFGATIIFCKNHFGSGIVQACGDHRGTVIYGSPLHYELMTHDRSDRTFPHLRMAVATTARLSQETAQTFQNRFGKGLNETYGIIEIGLPFINLEKSREKSGSVGCLLPDYEMQMIEHEDGLSAIHIRGPGLLDAYYEPWKTRDEILADGQGWFSTGDLGVLDSEGYLYIRGRSKEMISVGGMKFFPREAEEVLENHPAVKEACVFGQPDARRGEAPWAHLVIRGTESVPLEKELKDYCSQHLALYKIPEKFIFVARLTRTGSGKLIRNGRELNKKHQV